MNGDGWSGYCDTLDAAKAAAQADYTARILAALDTDAVGALVEAAARDAREVFSGSCDHTKQAIGYMEQSILARLKGGAA